MYYLFIDSDVYFGLQNNETDECQYSFSVA